MGIIIQPKTKRSKLIFVPFAKMTFLKALEKNAKELRTPRKTTS
jgi:hypothetical protein